MFFSEKSIYDPPEGVRLASEFELLGPVKRTQPVKQNDITERVRDTKIVKPKHKLPKRPLTLENET